MKTIFKNKQKQRWSLPLRGNNLLLLVGMCCCVLLFIGIAHYLTAYYNYNFMLKTEEQSLFLFTSEFFWECMQRAGGLLTYGGCFLTQFFYYPQLGSILYIGLLLLIVFFTIKAFRIPWSFFPLAFLPALMLLWSYTNLGYLLFVLKSPGYVFSNPLGVLVSLAAFWGYRSLRTWPMRGAFILLYIALSYPLFGFYTLFAGLLCIIYELITCFTREKEGRIYPVLMAGTAIALVPFIYFVQIYTRMLESDIYKTALPRFYFNELERELWMPFVFLFALLLLFIAFHWIKPGKKMVIWCACASFFLFGISVWKVYQNSYDDENFRVELEMDVAVSLGDWNRVLDAASRLEGEPTRLIVMNTHLALQKLGLAGDKMFQYKNGSQPYDTPRPNRYLRVLGARPLYYHYGDLNFSYRWCMEDAVENGWRVDYLKTMAKCALLNKEYPLAQKYINALKNTLFHTEWAAKYEAYVKDPELSHGDAEFSGIRPYAEFSDVLDGDGGMIEVYLLNNFAMMEGGPVELVEASLQCNLILKNIERFWPRFFHYIRVHDRIPVHYQEAALLYSYLERRVDVSRLNFDPQIVTRFRELIKLSEEFANKGEEYCKVAFAPSYGDTFWYYYFFVKGLKTH